MTDFIDGYSPQKLTAEVNVYLDGPPTYLEARFDITVNNVTQELEDALLAGLAAIAASISSDFPAADVSTHHVVSGGKQLS